jgi:hypothetical protein
MYTPGTILTLKSPKDPDPETEEAFPYNEVEVVGPSPIDHGGARGGDWEGASASGVIIKPLSNFGSTLDEPLGKLQALYEVTSVPETFVEAPKIRVIDSSSQSAGPTPEEVFAVEAPGEAPEEGQTRARTKPNVESPLEDPRKPVSASPLDD